MSVGCCSEPCPDSMPARACECLYWTEIEILNLSYASVVCICFCFCFPMTFLRPLEMCRTCTVAPQQRVWKAEKMAERGGREWDERKGKRLLFLLEPRLYVRKLCGRERWNVRSGFSRRVAVFFRTPPYASPSSSFPLLDAVSSHTHHTSFFVAPPLVISSSFPPHPRPSYDVTIHFWRGFQGHRIKRRCCVAAYRLSRRKLLRCLRVNVSPFWQHCNVRGARCGFTFHGERFFYCSVY